MHVYIHMHTKIACAHTYIVNVQSGYQRTITEYMQYSNIVYIYLDCTHVCIPTYTNILTYTKHRRRYTGGRSPCVRRRGQAELHAERVCAFVRDSQVRILKSQRAAKFAVFDTCRSDFLRNLASDLHLQFNDMRHGKYSTMAMVCVCVCMCVHVFIFVCMYMYMYVCPYMYVCEYIFMYLY